jgi:hypothetical protein
MSCYSQEIRLLFRGDPVEVLPGRMRRLRRRVLKGALVALVVLAPLPQWAQQTAQPVQPQLTSTAGIHLNGFSTYSGGDFLQAPSGVGGSGDAPLWLLTSGATADVAAFLGRRTQFTANYHAAYSYNHRFSVLNGFGHSVFLSLRSDPARHTVFTVSAAAETSLLSDALFDASYTMSVAQQSTSADQLAAGLLGNNTGAIASSPLELALAGGRRRIGAAYVGISHTHSRRLTSYVHAGAARELHSYSGDQQLVSRYPNVTIGTADAGLTYSLRRRTRITPSVTYTRSYSRLLRIDWQAAGMRIEQEIGRRSFVSLQGGFARISDPVAGGFGRSSYTTEGTLGTTKGYHTLAVIARRGVADLHGLGADTSVGAEGAWTWTPHNRPWSLGSSLGYERLEGGSVGMLQAWVGQVNAVRRLSTHFELVLAGVYVTDSGRNVRDWSPGPDRRR